jgi:hypothetical protein
VDEANNHGIWLHNSESLVLVARSGTHAPGVPSGVEFGPFERYGHVFSLNNIGQMALGGDLVGEGVNSTNDRGIWFYDSGLLTKVARGGDEVPGMPGVRFGYVTTPLLNDAGQLAFRSTLAEDRVVPYNEAIWVGSPGSLDLVARAGSHAPDTPSDVKFSGFGNPALNDAGQTAFFAGLVSSGDDPAYQSGIWSEGSGRLALVALEGAQAPGAPNGVTFRNFPYVVLNNRGNTAFRATDFRGEPDASGAEGIWSDVTGELAAVAVAETQAVGTPPGVMFRDFGGPVMNDAGQVVFAASIFGNGVDFTNDVGVWATDRTGQLQLIMRAGDVVEVAPGDFRTVRILSPSAFNNVGQLAFLARFADNSEGIFISNLVAIPEPDSLLLLLALAGAVISLRRSYL